MSIQRVPSVPFAQIANVALRDKRLSFKARGILALVLSHSGEWTAPMRWLESQSDHDGRVAIQAGLNELTDLGYRLVTRKRVNGEIRTVVVWRHAPTVQETRPTGNPTVGESDPQVTGASSEDHSSEQHRTEHQQELTQGGLAVREDPVQGELVSAAPRLSEARLRAAFDEFWSAYPRPDAKKAAVKSFRKAAAEVGVDVLIVGAKRYRDDPNRDPQFTAHAATWLNQGRWDDGLLPGRRTATAGDRRMQQYEHLMNQFGNGREIGQ